jgi:seryl-tRNA synthetase
MTHSKKLTEAFENFEVSFTLGAEGAQNLGCMLKAHAADLQALENAATVSELLEQLLKMQTSGNILKLTQAADELTKFFEDIAREGKKTAAAIEAAAKEENDEIRKLQTAVDDLKKRIEEGDSWRGEE